MAQIPPDQIARVRDAQQNVLRDRLVEQEVCEYWQVIFSARGISTLTKQDVMGFLSFKQNRRWREISREDITRDMDKLKSALSILLDETRPIATRLNEIEPGRGKSAVEHFGKAKMTPMLLVARPRDYGVWNDYSERSLTAMGLMPEFGDGDRLGERYDAVNAVLIRLAGQYHISLWRLDVILEQIARHIR